MNKDQPPPYVPNAPGPGFHAPPPQAVPQVNVHNIQVTPMVLGPSSQSMTCPSCHHQIMTSTEVEPSTKTHLFALLLFAFGCWCCCCVPYCMDSCQSTKHTCPNCHSYIGKYDN